MRADFLQAIRLELRGPIAQSPFSGKRKQPKLDYCRRQVKIFERWAEQTGESIFQRQANIWKHKCVQVNLDEL